MENEKNVFPLGHRLTNMSGISCDEVRMISPTSTTSTPYKRDGQGRDGDNCTGNREPKHVFTQHAGKGVASRLGRTRAAP